MLGISGSEFLVIILVVVIVVGPQRLPEYARKLTQAVRRLRVFLDDAKEQIAEEVGPELADLNLTDLDPRNYDPRKIVRDALGEDLDAIRKDLATPFQSVAKEARETADAVATGTAPRSTKSLTRMIDGKAEETRREREAQAEPSPSGAPDRDGSEGSSESSCRDSHDVDDTTGGTTAGVPVNMWMPAGPPPTTVGGPPTGIRSSRPRRPMRPWMRSRRPRQPMRARMVGSRIRFLRAWSRTPPRMMGTPSGRPGGSGCARCLPATSCARPTPPRAPAPRPQRPSSMPEAREV